MTQRPNLLALLSIFTGCFFTSIVCAQGETEFDPNKVKASFYKDKGDKHEFVANDTYRYRVSSSDNLKGLSIKVDGRWKKHGTYYSYSRGRLTGKTNYQFGKKHGEQIDYFKGGTVKQETYYEEGKIEGQQNAYNKHGVVSWVANYKTGRKEGMSTQYYSAKKGESPKVQFTEEYSNNRRHGNTLQYDKQGTLISRTKYVKGKKNGRTEWLN